MTSVPGTAIVVALSLSVVAAQDWPRPVGKVNDFASLLTAEERGAIDAQLEVLERDTSAEVAVVTIPSLGGRAVEEYATGLFANWGIGKKGQDNGVLILVARDDRAMRIEVGYGLEAVLPDGLAGAIIRETFTPRFQAGEYGTGIREGTTRVADIVRRNQPFTPEARSALDAAPAATNQSWLVTIVLSIFIGFAAFMAGTAAAARVLASTVMGLVFLGGSLLFAVLAAPLLGLVLLIALAAIVLAVAYRLGLRPSWRKNLRGTGARASGSRWILFSDGSGGGGSRSRSGGSGSGGSSSGSFGGGRSGGGGASGRW